VNPAQSSLDTTQPPGGRRGAGAGLSPWRFIVSFGVVSLLMDFVYEGARSITGPLLASLGASGLLIGIVTGVGESAALGLRVFSGPLANRSGRFWTWTIVGYVLTAVTVPLMGLSSILWVVCGLVIAERVGKAVRSPAKDTLVSHATASTGRGKGFAVHEAMDQTGALIGPLTVAAILALTGDDYAPALGILVLPGIAAVALLFWLRARVPNPVDYETDAKSEAPGASQPATEAGEPVPVAGTGAGAGLSLPRQFWIYAGFTAATMGGFATFGVVSFHLVQHHLIPTAAVPVVYAGAMAADAVAALATGWFYDRIGSKTLAVLPAVALASTLLAFVSHAWVAIIGALLWGAAVGIQDSTLRATVADMIPVHHRATAYGLYAGVMGAATFIGGALTGALYDVSVPLLVIVVAAIQASALALLWIARRRTS
jgi:MFS family permease